MSQVEVERFLGRLITDAIFRTKAAQSLRSACHNEGISVSENEIALLNGIDFARFAAIADTLDDSIRRR